MRETASNLYVVAVVAGQRIAVDAVDVGAVVDLVAIMPVPLAPSHVRGICALRSQILTVIDLSEALGQPSENGSCRALTMEVDGHHYAFVVASVEQVEPIQGKIHPVDASIGRDWAIAVTGRVQTESGTALLFEPQRIVRASVEMAQ